MIDPEKPVENPQDFYGQKHALRRIFSRIGAERPQSVAVIGGIKTGKTSLLNCIAHETTRREYLDRSDAYRFCRVDSGAQAFRDAFPLEFFSFLRSLANNYNLAYVTSSFLELQKLCVIKDIEESPFFNIFTNLSLGPLSLQEGMELLSALTGREDGELERIVSWAGSFPYVLKLIGKALTAGVRAPGVRAAGVRASGGPGSRDPEKEFLPALVPYFEKVLSILPKEAFSSLKNLARDKAPDPREVHVLRPLIKQGFLVEKEDLITSFAPAFSAYLRKNLSKKALQG
jgi:AAA+ ATPase superfamily predicted ATPase